jgi:hypothetical protein
MFENLIVSRTKSLEKNPLNLGIPRRFNKETAIRKQEKGV